VNRAPRIWLWVLGTAALAFIAATLFFVLWVNDFEYEQVTPDLHVVYTNAGGNVAVLKTGEGAVVVDTMTFSMQGQALRALAEELTGEEVAVVVNTHWHADHTHGNPAFARGVRIVSTDNTKRWLETLDGSTWQGDAAHGLPSETFERNHVITLGNKTIELHSVGRGHTDGDLVAVFREDGAIHMGDLFFNRLYPFVDLDTGGSVQAWSETLQAVLDLEFEHVIPGHGSLTDRVGLLEFKAMMEELAQFGREAARAGWTLEQALEQGSLYADENFRPLMIGPMTLVDRNALMGFAWREVQRCGPRVGRALVHADGVSSEVTAEYLRSVVAEISSDAYEGRGPGSAGDLRAREWLAGQFEAMGVAPGADKGYQQSFELVGVTSTIEGGWSFSSGFTAEPGREFVVNVSNQSESASFMDAELVFVGYGIQAPEYEWDDYKGMDVSGKVLVMLNNDPEWDPDLFAGGRRLYYGRWIYKYEMAARLGAAAAIIIHTTPSAGYPWQVVATSWSGAQFELPSAGEPHIEASAWMAESAMRRLLASAGHDMDALAESARSRDFVPVPLGVTSSLTLSAQLERTETANVLGVIEGCDARLGREAVILTAHHDHLGTGEEADLSDEDVIYNGALDNATGVAQVLAIAKALKALPEPPRRSIVFALVGAEEQGLLGSEYYAKHPTFHPGRIAANVNLDGANIWGEASDMIFIGLGKSSLDGIVSDVAEYTGRTLHGDQFPDQGFYYRSDQFSFAKIGVPGAYLDGGVEIIGKPAGWGRERIREWTDQHYHQPSDELTDDWVFDGMVADARFALMTTYLIAQADEMQSWRPGDEFAAARSRALRALERGVSNIQQ